MKLPKFYSLEKILSSECDYNIVYGERSNGKTHSVLMLILFGFHSKGINVNGYLDDGSQGAIIRRWDENFKGKYGKEMFKGITNNIYLGNILEEKSKGKWNSIEYQAGKWYLSLRDEEGIISKDDNPFCYGFAISSEEEYKSINYPNIKNILFDEMITRGYYIPNEFVKLTSILSTIIRLRDDVKIFMMGNTINRYCPYFNEMGLKHVKNQKQGTIDIYTYGESELKVAVEYYGDKDFSKSKKSNKYFAFDSPKLKMITTGEWELNIYPHLPTKYNRTEVMYIFYIIFEEDIIQGEIISKEDSTFIYFHRKTTPIGNTEYLVYQQENNHLPNYRRKITKPMTKIEKKIVDYFNKDKVFYQDNEVGDIVNNYIRWCKTTE